MSSHKESGGLDLKSKNVNWSLLCFFNAPIPCETQSQSQVSGGNFQADTQEYFKSLLLDQMHMANSACRNAARRTWSAQRKRRRWLHQLPSLSMRSPSRLEACIIQLLKLTPCAVVNIISISFFWKKSLNGFVHHMDKGAEVVFQDRKVSGNGSQNNFIKYYHTFCD